MENINIQEFLKSLIQTAADFGFNIAGALVILLVGWIAIRFSTKLLRRLLNKIGVEKLSNYVNSMELFGQSTFTISLTKIISTFVYYLLLLLVWVAATDVLGIGAVSKILNDLMGYAPNLLVAFVYLLIGIFLADLARKFILTTLQSLGIPSANLIAGFVFYFLIVNILLGALTQAKISTEFIASNISIILAGIVFAFAIGYGLASKDIAANLLSAFYWKDKLNLGDQIEFDGIAGKIIAIEKSHLLLENDAGQVIVPMHKVSKNSIIIKK